MTRWTLIEYPDRHSPLGEPRSVGVYEDVEGLGSYEAHGPILGALWALKSKRARCLPIVFEQGKKADVLHTVREGFEYDAMFTSIELAHCWVEHRRYQRFRQPGEPESVFGVTSMLVENFPQWVQEVAPKSVWEWLREPAPYCFDAS